MSGKKKVVKYRANAHAQKNPFSLVIDGSRVAVGKAIEVKPTPPKLPFTIPEATSEQYGVLLLKRGLTKWVESYEETNEIFDASESNTGTA